VLIIMNVFQIFPGDDDYRLGLYDNNLPPNDARAIKIKLK